MVFEFLSLATLNKPGEVAAAVTEAYNLESQGGLDVYRGNETSSPRIVNGERPSPQSEL